MNVTLDCPVCGEALTVRTQRSRGDVVPYGSTFAVTPDSVEYDVGFCPNRCELTEAQQDQLIDRAEHTLDDYDPREDRDIP